MLSRKDEFQRGWPVLLACAFGTGTGVAPLEAYSLGAFIEPLNRDFGWTRAQVAAAPFFFSIGTLIFGVAVGALADRLGPRPVVLWSQILLVTAFVSMGIVGGHYWTLYAGYFLLAAFGAGTLPMVWSRAVTGWFVRARGVALGLSLVGTGLIGAALPLYVSWLVGIVGWRGAYAGLGLLTLVLGFPLALWAFHEPPGDARARAAEAAGASVVPLAGMTYAEAVKTPCFWQMTLSFFLAAFGIGGAMIHFLPLLTDRGIETAAAAALVGLMGIAVTAGRLVSGFLLDLIGGPKVAFVMFMGPAVACVLLLYSGAGYAACGTAIVLMGLAAGAEHDVAGYLSAQIFGRLNYAAIYGTIYAVYGIGAGIGEIGRASCRERVYVLV